VLSEAKSAMVDLSVPVEMTIFLCVIAVNSQQNRIFAVVFLKQKL